MGARKANVFCVVGAVIGVVAIFSGWVSIWVVELNLIDVWNQAETEGVSDYYAPILLFIVGTLIAFLSPLGGFLQVVGAPWFIIVWANRHEGEILSTVGPYLGIASAIIVLVSVVRPIGPGLMSGPFATRDRLFNFGTTPEGKVRTVERQEPQPHWVGKYCKHCGRPLADTASMCPGCGRLDLPSQEETDRDAPRTRFLRQP